MWKLGEVLEVNLGREDVRHVATLRTTNGTVRKFFATSITIVKKEDSVLQMKAYQGEGI